MDQPTITVATAPVSFGVDEILQDDAWMPEPDQILDMIVSAGYAGTELGPPGFLGDAAQLRERLSSRNLQLVGSFLPQRFSRVEHAEEDRHWLRESLKLIQEGAPEGSKCFAILCDGFGERDRMLWSGRIPEHPEAWLPPERFPVLIDNLHRAAEICQRAGFDTVLHFHAGTYIETADEIHRVMDAIDPSLLGLCLDTGHARFGGADPLELASTYKDLIRHVHIKDCKVEIMDDVKREGKGLEEALARGVFCELGEGDSGIGEVIATLKSNGYTGWLVVEQDRFLRQTDTLETLLQSSVRNREYLKALGV
jgi:inosose dehydratase